MTCVMMRAKSSILGLVEVVSGVAIRTSDRSYGSQLPPASLIASIVLCFLISIDNLAFHIFPSVLYILEF